MLVGREDVGSMLFKKSSTVLLGSKDSTRLSADAEGIEGGSGSGLDADFSCFNFRDAIAAFRASSSALRCCSISLRLGGAESALSPVDGINGGAAADNEDDAAGAGTSCGTLERLRRGVELEAGRVDGIYGVNPLMSRLDGRRRLSS